MPVAMRTTYQKAEAKYNVTTEFPSLGLHSAAATGNVGLVEYALEHGQPINSVLDGVLPLHAACAGGNVQVVKLLIDHGADVNAPRLPRRYSNDKNRDSSAPIVGTSGSTPLHFASANGNTDAVNLLLLHGAHANRSDKHGVTPEMLARRHGWLECAEVLKQWLVNKDRDLRERPGGKDEFQVGSSPRERIGSFCSDADVPQSSSGRRRLQAKHSIDHVLNKLKSSGTDSKLSTTTPPSSPTRPFGEYTFVPVSPDEPPNDESRRPSLPHIFQPPSGIPHRTRKTSTPTINNSPSPRRPRSAGNGAEGKDQEPTNSPSGTSRTTVRKLGSKYSLMNLFKKGQAGDTGTSVDNSQPTLSPPAPNPMNLASSPSQPSPLSNFSQSTEPIASSTSRSGFRFHRGSDASVRTPPQQSATLHRKISATLGASPRPTAVDIHNALAQDRHQPRDRSRSTGGGARFPDDRPNPPSPGSSPLARFGLLRTHEHGRDRSGSGASLGSNSGPGYRGGAVFDDDVIVVAGDAPNGDIEKPEGRPSILKAHSRTSSGGHIPGAPGYRALRFDPPSSVSSGMKHEGDLEGLRVTPILRGSNSVGSLGKYRRHADIFGRGTSPEPRLSEENLTPDSAPAIISDFNTSLNNDNGEVADDEEEEDFGQPLNGEESSIIDPSASKPPLLLRERGRSFSSSSQSSLSPIMSNGAQDSSLISAEFPFSINRPIVLYPDEVEPTEPTPGLLRVPSPGDKRSPSPGDKRGRGDSVSSTSTTDSHSNPQLSVSGTTSGSGSETVTTPWFSSPGRDEFLDVRTESSPGKTPQELGLEDIKQVKSLESKTRNTNGVPGVTGTLNERRHRTPPDINITSISSHAQAEALVQRAQQDILEMAQTNELTPAVTVGPSPLSARLAAYGESLALERRLREEAEQQKALSELQVSHSSLFIRSGAITPTNSAPRFNGVERQHSLEHRNRPKSRSKAKDPKRPSTAEGLSPRTLEQNGRFHQHSTSEFGISPPSRLSIEHDPALSDEETIPAHSKSATIPSTMRDPSPGPRIPRSRTPLPGTGDDGQLSRISSLEGADTDSDLGLLRVSTAPHGPARGAKASSSKLTRMGFPPMEQVRSNPPSSKRFGALRSLVQTLKGRQ